MRVLHLINSLGQGGAERSLAEMLPHLSQRGVESTVVCFEQRNDGFHREVVELGFEVHVMPPAGLPTNVRRVRGLLGRLQPDLMHTTLFDADVVGRFAAAGTSVPVVGSIVNMSYDPVRLADPRITKWKLEAARMLDGWTARHLCDHFHAITEAVSRSATKHLGIPSERITVIPRGRDPQRLGTDSPGRRAVTRERLGISPDAPVVINVGRQEYQKGQQYLLEALDRLRRHGHPDVVLLVAGRSGAESPRLEDMVQQLGLESSARFLGHRDDVPDLLACADVFAFPSLFEGLGGSLIEAMALGVPIVASDLAPIREVVDPESARLVPPGSSDALADAIAGLLQDPAAAELLRANGKRIFRERYTLRAVSDATVEMYRSVAQHARN